MLKPSYNISKLNKKWISLWGFLSVFKEMWLLWSVLSSLIFSWSSYLWVETISTLIENYKNVSLKVIEKPQDDNWKITTILDYVCRETISIICEQRLTIIEKWREFRYSINFNSNNTEIKDNNELNRLFDELSWYFKSNPKISEIIIKWQSSPEWLTENSLLWLDNESLKVNQSLANKRAFLVRDEVLGMFPELKNVTSKVEWFVNKLSLEDFDNLKEIVSKLWEFEFIQDFIKSYNKWWIQNLSEEDIEFLNRIFDRSTIIELIPWESKYIEEQDILSPLFLIVLIMIFSWVPIGIRLKEILKK